MFREVQVSYVETKEEEGKLKRVTEILSEGVYAYLKKGGRCGKKSGRKGLVKQVLRGMPDAVLLAGEVRQPGQQERNHHGTEL